MKQTPWTHLTKIAGDAGVQNQFFFVWTAILKRNQVFVVQESFSEWLYILHYTSVWIAMLTQVLHKSKL